MAHECHCFPSEDEEFAAAVAACEAGLDPEDREQGWALELAIRGRYPLARVHVQDPLAIIRGPRIWYVYRDGGLLSRDW